MNHRFRRKDGDWIYWTGKFDEGSQYKKWYRKPAAGGEEILILDENKLAEGKEYFRLGAFSVSPDGRLLAYSYDDNGSERFDVHFRNLETGEELKDVIPGTLSSLVWSADSKSLLYGLANENWRTDNARCMCWAPIRKTMSNFTRKRRTDLRSALA